MDQDKLKTQLVELQNRVETFREKDSKEESALMQFFTNNEMTILFTVVSATWIAIVINMFFKG